MSSKHCHQNMKRSSDAETLFGRLCALVLIGAINMPCLQHILNGVDIARPIGYGPLRLVPLFQTEPRPQSPDFLLSTDALNCGLLRITEVSDEGVISELLVTNDADVPVLLLEGEEFVGAMQNRLADTDVLVAPHASIRIPVSCCEQGRWSSDQTDLEAGAIATPQIRAPKNMSVNRNLSSNDIVQSDQGRVWCEVDNLLKRTGSTSETSAMSAGYQHRESHVLSVLDRCAYPPGTAGVVAIVNGQFAALDLFDSPRTLERIWSRLICSYSVDTRRSNGPSVAGTEDIKALMVLDTLRKMECVVRDGVGQGQDWRFESSSILGSALVWNETALHLSAFPKCRN